MRKLLTFLQGKKTTIFSILALTNTFFSAMNLYSQEVCAYIQGVLTIVAGGAVYQTNQLGIKK